MPYVLLPAAGVEVGERAVFETDKRLHVSPFMPMDQSYTWWFSEPGREARDPDGRPRDGTRDFHATLTARRVPLTTAALRPRLVRYPLMPRARPRADPLAGRAALAEADAVPSQAAVRAGQGLGETMRIAADVARRLSFRALSALQGGEVVLRYPTVAGAVSATAWAVHRRRDQASRRVLAQARDADARRLRRVVRRRRLGLRRPRRAVRAPRAQPRGDGGAPDPEAALPAAGAPARPASTTDARGCEGQYPCALRPRERPVRADARSDDDVLLRVLGATGDDARGGAARQDPSCLREAAARARRSRARDRVRLGRVRDPGGHRLRLSRHGSDALTESGRVRPRARRRRRG